jgi:hypothetical protein
MQLEGLPSRKLSVFLLGSVQLRTGVTVISQDVGAGGGGSAPLREVSLPIRPGCPALMARTRNWTVSLYPTVFENDRWSVFCQPPPSTLYW